MKNIYIAIGKVVIGSVGFVMILYRVLMWTFPHIPEGYQNEMFLVMIGSFIGGMLATMLFYFIIET